MTSTRPASHPPRRWWAAPLALTLVAAACGSDDGEDGSAGVEAASCAVGEVDGDLAIYNWSEYIGPEQVDAFAAEFGVSVSQDSYDSNEAMQAVIAAGNSGYDLIVPSDYMVRIMVEAGNVQPLDQAALPNLANLDPEFVGLDFDPDGSHSVPYQVGTTGLGVDKEVLGEDFPRSWSLVFDPAVSEQYSGRITLLNDARETLGAALIYLGYSVNTTDQGELDEAKVLVSDAKGRLAAFDTDSANELLIDGEIAIAHNYSGDLFTNFVDTDDPGRYEYFVPQEGGVRWIDNMAIPFDAGSPCTAHTFINYLLDAEQGAVLTNFNYYDTPNAAAVDGLDEELVEFVTDESVVVGGPDSLELLVDTGDFEINYTDAFTEAKS